MIGLQDQGLAIINKKIHRSRSSVDLIWVKVLNEEERIFSIVDNKYTQLTLEED